MSSFQAYFSGLSHDFSSPTWAFSHVHLKCFNGLLMYCCNYIYSIIYNKIQLIPSVLWYIYFFKFTLKDHIIIVTPHKDKRLFSELPNQNTCQMFYLALNTSPSWVVVACRYNSLCLVEGRNWGSGQLNCLAIAVTKLSVRPQFRMEMPGFDVLKVPKAAQAQDPPRPVQRQSPPMQHPRFPQQLSPSPHWKLGWADRHTPVFTILCVNMT